LGWQDTIQFCGQFSRLNWLHESSLGARGLRLQTGAVSAPNQDLKFGVEHLECFGKARASLAPTAGTKPKIQQGGIYLVLPGNSERFFAVARRQHVVAKLLQHWNQGFPQHFVFIHAEDGPLTLDRNTHNQVRCKNALFIV
jgi:hypothetical protein